ncbi:MAG TPA: glycosyltransferase family 4 protein [Chthoniobacterales bacterium]|jgi:glycosyltransferase involved in cell wall biosynthesis
MFCAYLFERFPSFTQTFCYREIAELRRQNFAPSIFSIRRPHDEPAQEWDPAIAAEVEYLPNDDELVREIDGAVRKGKLPAAVGEAIAKWGRQSDFLRLYQAAWLGPRLQARGVRHVHAHFAGMAARTAFWIARFFSVGFSFTAHANDIFSPKAFSISLGELVSAARAVVTVSDFGVDFLREKFPDHSPKFYRVYNGIEIDRFEQASVSRNRPEIISIGRLIEKKGFGDLIEACRLLLARDLDFHCEIIGEGPLEADLRAQIECAGLTKSVALRGPQPQSEIVRRLAQSAVFALPCVTQADGAMDNLPTVVMEAMAAGLPVVSTNLGGIPEMVRDGETGLIVAEHQPAELAAALARLLADRALAQSLGESGRRLAAERFAIAQSACALRDLFERY